MSHPTTPTDGAIPVHGTGEPILQVQDVRLRFGGVVALDGPSFQVGRGQICGLIGPNGAGKTTLFNCISRVYEPNEGRILFEGQDLLGKKVEDIPALGIARTFQNLGLFNSLSVLENVMVGGHHRTKRGVISTLLHLPGGRREEQAERERARAILADLRLESVADDVVANLPFGTLKRVELARALMAEPRMLLLDEPANGLNHTEVGELAETVRRLRDERNLSVLLVEHHMGMVMSISDSVVALNFGRVVADGTPEEVRNDPHVIEAYLGGAA